MWEVGSGRRREEGGSSRHKPPPPVQHPLTHYDDSGHPADVFGRLARITIWELRGDASRDDALTLLAADAFMTYSCDAAAELEPGRLGDLR